VRLLTCEGVVCVRGEMLFVLTSGVLCRLVTALLGPIDSRPLLLLVWAAALRALLQAGYEYLCRVCVGASWGDSGCSVVRVGLL